VNAATVTCPSCGQETPAGFPRCANCGAALAAASADRREERKVVTVVFCDVVGSTARADGADPEDVRAALTAFYERVRADLERFGGTVEKFIGDAVMAVFGAPVAHEDDPERAVRAALAIRDWARDEGELQVRIAVNTGEALVALGARSDAGEAMVAGDVVNTAARLQSAAPENGILVGEVTHRSTQDAIEYSPAEPVQAKGKAGPVPVWVALEARARVAVELEAPATPLVGRERERELLLGAFGRARDERSTELVTIVGVPGIGKSRLVAELYAEIEREAELTRWRHGRSLPYGEGLAFWALAEMVRAEAGIRETDTAGEAARKLEDAVAAVLPAADADWAVARLRPLVGLDAAGASREESFGGWRRFLEALAEQRPTVLVFEDLHWAGDDVLDFVDELADWVTDVPLLVVVTARPELVDRRPGWGGGKRNAHTLSLAPLAREETARLLAALLDRHLLPAETQQALLARAGGNPLYAEQFARMLEERGGLGDELPESVQAIIAARLDSLPADEKRLLLDAAVFGRTFWLGALAGHERAEEQLRGLQRKEFVRRERRSTVEGEAEFSFAHLLVRDVAYAQIPRSQRAEKHVQAARWIESLSADRSEDISELLAHHYLAALELAQATGLDRTELVEPAIAALAAATQRALALSAFAQAERYAASELELLAEGDVLRPRALFMLAQAQFELGRAEVVETCAEAAALFMANGDTQSAAEAEISAANWLWNLGRSDEAHAASERALELVRDAPPSRVKAAALVERSRLLMLAGRGAEAAETGREGLGLAEQFGDERLQARALITLGAPHVTADETALRRGIEIADRGDLLVELVRGNNNLGETLILRGELAEVEELYEAAAARVRRVGMIQAISWIDAQTCALTYHTGDWERCERALADFFAVVEQTKAHVLEFDATGIEARLAEARGDLERAGERWDRALELVREVKDPQAIGPTLTRRGRFLLGLGRAGEAGQHLDEVLTLRDEEGRAAYYTWLVDLGWLLHDLGRPDEFPPVRHEAVWSRSGLAIAQGDFAAAADLLGAAGLRTYEADARLRAAEELARDGHAAEAAAQRDRALAFYRGVGATAYVRRAEALLAAAS
jgi:class 3 adenylate cyclase/tetratricopeptide (TPR) repeat protein